LCKFCVAYFLSTPPVDNSVDKYEKLLLITQKQWD